MTTRTERRLATVLGRGPVFWKQQYMDMYKFVTQISGCGKVHAFQIT